MIKIEHTSAKLALEIRRKNKVKLLKAGLKEAALITVMDFKNADCIHHYIRGFKTFSVCTVLNMFDFMRYTIRPYKYQKIKKFYLKLLKLYYSMSYSSYKYYNRKFFTIKCNCYD